MRVFLNPNELLRSMYIIKCSEAIDVVQMKNLVSTGARYYRFFYSSREQLAENLLGGDFLGASFAYRRTIDQSIYSSSGRIVIDYSNDANDERGKAISMQRSVFRLIDDRSIRSSISSSFETVS